MNNPALLVVNAGYGATPPCPQARFMPGDVVKIRRLKWLRHLPRIAAVAIVVPPDVPPEYAMADAHGRPRPLLISRKTGVVRYLVGFDGDPVPHLLPEKALLPSGEPRVDVAWSDAA